MGNSDARLGIAPATMQRYVDVLGRCGAQADGSLIRLQYDAAWGEARAVLSGLMTAAGLAVHSDSVGNLFGTLSGRQPRPVILTGSHIDTVVHGGRYDGALGVLAGIAALAHLKETAGSPDKTLQVVALCEEEASRFHANFFGSRAILGLVDAREPETLVDDDGRRLGEAMVAVGLDPAAIPSAHRDDIEAFIELHIEQGRTLYDRGMDIGIVTTITALAWQVVTVHGQADHAGTTPMSARRDAMLGAAQMAGAIAEVADEIGHPAVATTGKWSVQPGGSNIVPEQVTFTIDARHPDEAVLDGMLVAVARRCTEIAAQRHLEVSIDTVKRENASPTDQALRAVLASAAERQGATSCHLPSGAGHDSQLFARHLPTAMLFVPSVEGRSHVKEEYTPPEPCAVGANVLATALHQLAYTH